MGRVDKVVSRKEKDTAKHMDSSFAPDRWANYLISQYAPAHK